MKKILLKGLPYKDPQAADAELNKINKMNRIIGKVLNVQVPIYHLPDISPSAPLTKDLPGE